MKEQKGFTLIEILVVMAIVAVLSVAYFFQIGALNASSALNSAKTTVFNSLEESRNRAVTGYGTSDQGVLIGNGQLTLFEGTSYSGSGGTIIFLPPFVTMSNVGTSIVFKRITGEPTATPPPPPPSVIITFPVNITLKNVKGTTAVIIVNSNGTITVP